MYSRRESCKYAPGTGSPDFVSRIRAETSDHSPERTSPSRLERSRSFSRRSHDRRNLVCGKDVFQIEEGFNPRRPRGRRPRRPPGPPAPGEPVFQPTPPGARAGTRPVSIHAARAGGDVRMSRNLTATNRFQSTPPARAATQRLPDAVGGGLLVSIHAARAGGDLTRPKADKRIFVTGFNPRRPRGRRLGGSTAPMRKTQNRFNPRRPRGRRRR